MPVILYIVIGLLLVYALLIWYYELWWRQIPDFNFAPGTASGVKITVIIPARNEEINIQKCLQSLSLQTYPAELLEIIVVNDHSTDNTAAVVQSFSGVRLINLADHITDPINSYKKKAIEVAVAASSGDLIVTTDADCTSGPEWIAVMAAFYHQYRPAFIAAGVKIATTGSLLSVFQSLDFLTLQGITGASVHKKFHSMCNGANMAYEKKAFYEVGGFRGIENIASGDDMLLMHKIFLKYPERVAFLKNRHAIVTTEPETSWRAFMNQRIRWASKADKYDDKRIFAVLLLVYFLNVSILFLAAAAFWHPYWFVYAGLVIVAKYIVEISFMQTISDFFSMRQQLIWFPFLQPLHIIYTVIAGFLGKFGRYKWKGRKVN